MEVDDDVDVCVCCGRYYGMTNCIRELWEKSFNYRNNPNAVMPQFCHRCMRDHAWSNRR